MLLVLIPTQLRKSGSLLRNSESLLSLNSKGPIIREGPMFSVKSALLTREEKNLIRRAIFVYQKDLYMKYGDLTEEQHMLISDIADKLSLR